MNQRIWIKCMATAVWAALSVYAAYATDATVAGDAYVNSATPATNYGGLSNLYVGNGGTALIQFDLSSLPAGTTSAQIGKATLKLYVNRINTSGVVNLLPVTSAWSESSVTYATIPTLGSAVASFTPTVAQQFIIIDITSLVQGWVTTPASNYGIALTSTAGNIVLDSKENDETSHVAHLDITVISQGSQGPQGIQGTQGPIGPAGPTGAIGPAGITGLPGANGTAATINLGLITTGAPGSSASVVNTGSSSAAILSFVIPQGPTGPQGPQGSIGAATEWASGTTYSIGNVVFCNTTCATNGSSYVSLINSNTGYDPSANPADWQMIARVGATGAQGSQGPQGS